MVARAAKHSCGAFVFTTIAAHLLRRLVRQMAHQPSPSHKHLRNVVEADVAALECGHLSRHRLPTADRDIDIMRFDLDGMATPAGLFRRDDGPPRSCKGIEHEFMLRPIKSAHATIVLVPDNEVLELFKAGMSGSAIVGTCVSPSVRAASTRP
jgi:hypothetical protein